MNGAHRFVFLAALSSCTPLDAPAHPSETSSATHAAPDACVDMEDSCDDSANDASTPQSGAMEPDASPTRTGSGQSDRDAPETDAGTASKMDPRDGGDRERATSTSSMQIMGAQTGGADAQAAQDAQDAMGNDTDPGNAADGPSLTPVPPMDSECEYVEVRAQNDAEGAPFEIPAGATDLVQCFLSDKGFESPTQALGFSALPDKTDLVKYIVLRTLERSSNRGAVVTCNDAYPTHQMVAAWAPGASDWYYPKDVGVDLGRGLFILEIHYNNPGDATTDRSGMRICTTTQPRPIVASMSWLGSQNFSIPARASDYAVTGRCMPTRQREPIHMLRVLPYMGGLGKHATMRIERIDGSVEPLLDVDYTPSVHNIYEVPSTVREGDTVVSTCKFDNPRATSVSVGIGANYELCHFMVLAYPAGALVDDALSVENGSCI